MRKRAKRIRCQAAPTLSYVDDGMLFLNKTAVNLFYGSNFGRCTYRAVYRKQYQENEDTIYWTSSAHLVDSVKINDEFVNVHCFDVFRNRIYENFHLFAQVKPKVEERCARIANSSSGSHVERPFNVILLGVDSVSRLAFHRQMPRTSQFLKKILGAYEMKGYNKVEDNTFVNLIPILTGKFVEELPWNESVSYKPFDDYRFVYIVLLCLKYVPKVFLNVCLFRIEK